MTTTTKFRLVYPAIFLIAALYVVITNFAVISPILLSLFLILLITLALNPIVARMRDFLGRRDIATALMAFGFLAVMALTLWAFYGPFLRIMGDVFHRIPGYLQQLQEPLHRLDSAQTHTGMPPGQRLQVDTSAILSHLGKWAQDLVSNTAALVGVALTVFVGVVYTLMNPRPVFRAFLGMIPESRQDTAVRIAQRMAEFVPRWALAMLIGMAAVGSLVFLAVWPILGFQNAVLMAVIAFIFEAIPYVGAIVAGIPALLIAIQQGGSAPTWVVIAYVCIQLLEHNIINPLIVAASVRQHPLAVITSVLFCLPTFGILGVLLAVPLVATLEIFYDEIYRPRFLPNTSPAELDEMTRQMLGGRTVKSSSHRSTGKHIPEESPAPRLRHPRLAGQRP